MDERLRLFLWILGCGGTFGLLGSAFGSLAGFLAWRSGRVAGTALGMSVARAFARVARREYSPGQQGAIVGAVDGLLFLGVLGGLFGLWGAFRGDTPWKTLAPAAAFAVLMAGAVFFGVLAYGAIRVRGWALAAQVAGCVVGALIGEDLGGLTGMLCGAGVGGIAAGLLVLSMHQYSPEFIEPDARKKSAAPPPPRRSSTDISPAPPDTYFPPDKDGDDY